jgi:hypothetical protein
MPISYVGAGSAVQTVTTTLTLAGDASSQPNDIHIAHIISINNTAITAPDATWFEISQANFTGSRGAIFWKRVLVAGAGSYAFGVAGTTTSFGIVTSHRGCKVNGNPYGTSTTSNNGAADSITYATIVPHSNSGSLLAVGLYAEDSTTPETVSGSVYTFAAPTVDVEQATNEDATIVVSIAPMTTNAASGALTQVMATPVTDAVNQGILIDLMSVETEVGGGGGSVGVTYPRLNRRGIR